MKPNLLKSRICFLPALAVVLLFSFNFPAPNKRVLVFAKTAGYYHKSIPDGIAAIYKLGLTNGFQVDTTTDGAVFNPKQLKQYAAVIFLNTTGDVLNDDQQEAFIKYIHAGNGFVGVHAASDTEYGWPWYGRLVGAYFVSHPAVQPATLQLTGKKHLAVNHLPATWQRTDEWYNFKSISDSLQILMTIDENSYTGKRMGTTHPMSWYHSFEGGRSFYTGLGHTTESYTTDSLYLKHLLGGIRYAMGNKK